MTDKEPRQSEKTETKNESDPSRSKLNDEGQGATASKDVETYTDFDSMGLQENLLRGIYGYGFERPSVIQQKAGGLTSKSDLFRLSFHSLKVAILLPKHKVELERLLRIVLECSNNWTIPERFAKALYLYQPENLPFKYRGYNYKILDSFSLGYPIYWGLSWSNFPCLYWRNQCIKRYFHSPFRSTCDCRNSWTCL
jgi:hypothetical protein